MSQQPLESPTSPISSEENDDDFILEQECPYEPLHSHAYPRDWQFGGASGTDPRTDPRYRADTYTYFGADLRPLHVTQTPLCDDQAIDEFTRVANFGPGFNPKYIQVRRHGEKNSQTLPVVYDIETDEVYETQGL